MELNSKIIFKIVCLLIFIQLNNVCCQKKNLHLVKKQILDSILDEAKYHPETRPLGGNSSIDDPAIIRTNIYVRKIDKINDIDMEYSVQLTFRSQWNDNRLMFDDMKGQIRYLQLTDTRKIWTPDYFFYNEKQGHFHSMIKPNVLIRIYPNGAILYSTRISLVLSCPMDLKYYPFDTQMCSIKIASYGYTTEDLVLLWKESDPVQVTKNLNLPRFTLQKYNTSYCTSRTNTGEYSCLRLDFQLKRESSNYIMQIYIPCIMLVIISWLSFWLDPDAISGRVFLEVTTLLLMTVLISGFNSSVAPVSYTKAVDVWTGVCLTFVFGALLEFVLVNYISQCHANQDALNQQQEQTNLMNSLRKRLLFKFPARSKRIDVISRILFPSMFVLFNLVYWITVCSKRYNQLN